jgi:hypothetical protein
MARPHGTLRDLIRSNARRKPRRRLHRMDQANIQPQDGENYRTFASEERHEGSGAPIQEYTSIVLRRDPECNALDPFYTLPVEEAGQTQFLLFHCKLSAVLY